VPPSAEQARIVARIDELLEELQLARQALWKVPALMNKFHQSILSKAFRGELVEKTSSVTSRSNLSNVPGGEAYHRVASNGQELPEGWVWVTLGKIADVRGGVTKGRKFNGKQTVKMPYLRVANVQSGYLDLSLVKEIEVLPGEVAEYSLHFGDVLFTEGGDRDKLGRGTVWRDEVPNCLHQNHVFRARISSVGVSPEYVSLFSQSTSAREYFFSVASQTVNLASINITSLRALPIPLAPFDEQERIVIVLGDAARRVKFVGEIVQGNLHRCTELEQSILAKAFKGELVSQDLDDEPASILLHRLRTISTNAAPKRREEARKVTS
jgi:type I restriction enzyme S subunit